MDYHVVRSLRVGDRVRIRPDRWPLPGTLDQVGTVAAVCRMPRNSYLVSVDGDTKRDRQFFFYSVEVAANKD